MYIWLHYCCFLTVDASDVIVHMHDLLLAGSVNAIAQEKKTEKTEQPKKPNILVIMPDDVGWYNISAYNMGMMGYRTPNIDRIAREGTMFTDAYAQQSCTAGRAAFITGQSPFRTGLTKVGMPGADLGLKTEDPTIATYLKTKGYMTGQFGKNHLGDLDDHLHADRILHRVVPPAAFRGAESG